MTERNRGVQITQCPSNMRVSERFHNIEGILYLYGNGVVQHGRLREASILDVAPTLLALLDLPTAQDMPGRVLTEAFDRPRPLRRIATYEGGAPDQVAKRESGPVNDTIRKRLESLGYLGGRSSPQGERNRAGLLFEEGRYVEAVELYQQLLKNDPQDASLRTSLAGTLGAMGRLKEARKQLDLALELEPLNVEAYHNRGVLLEREGKPQEAISDYQTALRYNPQYAPSRQALIRLVGSADVRAPQTEEEARAQLLAETASQQARQGNYEEAFVLLDHAQKLAPKLVLIYQYQANVAYLKGDLARARAALRRGLELEPNNALLKHNLEQMQGK